MSFITKILGSGLKEVVSGVSDIADKFITTSDEKNAFNLELQKLSQEKELKFIEEANKELELYLKDTQSARDSNTRIQESTNASWLSKNVLYLLALVVTLGFFGLLGYMLKSEIPETNKDMFNILLGSLGTAWISIISYFFGSSMGSKTSSDTIRRIAEQK